jgi:hypothetical protein
LAFAVSPLLVRAIFFNIGRVILPLTALVAAVLRSPLLIAVVAYQAILGVGMILPTVIIIPPASPTIRLRADALIGMES